MSREKLGSRLGFILLSAGCAIGIGNVWKFPYIVGQNGGGLFVIIYLVFLAILGIPVLTMEFSVGRAAQCSPVKMYQQIEPKGSKWHYHGVAAMIGSYILLMFYTTVAGWMLRYFFSTAGGALADLDAAGISEHFDSVLSDPLTMTLFVAIVLAAAVLICSIGLKNGLERVTKVMMLALLVIMVILAINSFFMEGGEAGLAFYLKPNIEEIQKVGIGNVIVNAMNQAFFTLSVGMGGMEIFGSYMDREHTLLGESLQIAGLDTFVALMSGLIIFPACFAYGINPGAGPELIFITLPNVFIQMPGGRFWGALFFLFMTFAAFSTIIGVFENIIASCMDKWGISRKKASLINGVIILIGSVPAVLGYNVWSSFQPRGAGSTVLDLEDFIVSNLLLPGGAVVFLLFCMTGWGWGFENYLSEVNTGKGLKMPRFLRGYLTYVMPCIMLVIIIMGLIG